jgi:hypothetical protein
MVHGGGSDVWTVWTVWRTSMSERFVCSEEMSSCELCVRIIIAKRHFIASFQKGIFSQLTCEPHIWVVLACCSMHHITARRSLRPLPSTILNFPTTTISDIKSTTARGLAQHINEASACFHCAAVTLYCFRPRFTTALPNHEIS